MNKKQIIQHIGISSMFLGSSLLLIPPLFMPKDYPKSIKGVMDNLRDTIIKDWIRKTSFGFILSGSIVYFLANNII